MIRVLIASPVRLIADLVDNVLRNQTDMQVVGCVTNADQVLRRKSDCDIILASATLPNDEIHQLLASIREPRKKPRLVIFGVPDANPVSLYYLELGAAGCVCVEDSIDKLLYVMRAAAAEGIALSPQVARLVVDRIIKLADKFQGDQSNESVDADNHTLTTREKQVLELIAQGYGNHEIAKRLTIQVGTTKNHVHNILGKLKVNKRKDAVAYWSLGLNQS